MTVNDTAPNEYDKYLAQYEQLFLETILPIVYGNSKSISYIPSSTTNGYLELNFSLPEPMIERYNNKTPGSIYGDTGQRSVLLHYIFYRPDNDWAQIITTTTLRLPSIILRIPSADLPMNLATTRCLRYRPGSRQFHLRTCISIQPPSSSETITIPLVVSTSAILQTLRKAWGR